VNSFDHQRIISKRLTVHELHKVFQERPVSDTTWILFQRRHPVLQTGNNQLPFKPFEVTLSERSRAVVSKFCIVTWRPKAGTVERIKAAIASQRSFKHMSATTNKYATIEEPLEEVFSIRSVSRLYSEDRREVEVESRSRQLPVCNLELYC
jgi:hypothetical protein